MRTGRLGPAVEVGRSAGSRTVQGRCGGSRLASCSSKSACCRTPPAQGRCGPAPAWPDCPERRWRPCGLSHAGGGWPGRHPAALPTAQRPVADGYHRGAWVRVGAGPAAARPRCRSTRARRQPRRPVPWCRRRARPRSPGSTAGPAPAAPGSGRRPPHTDAVLLAEVTLAEHLVVGLPAGQQPTNGRRRQPGCGAEEGLQRRHEVAGGQPVQVQQRQHLSDLRAAAAPGRQDHLAEPGPLASLWVDPAVLHPRRAHRDRTGRSRHPALAGVAVAPPAAGHPRHAQRRARPGSRRPRPPTRPPACAGRLTGQLVQIRVELGTRSLIGH